MMAIHQPMRLSHQASNCMGMSKWVHPSGIDTGKEESGCAHFPLLSALAGVRMLVHIPPLASISVMLSIGAGLAWRAIWAAGIQGSCTCQPFLNSIFEIWGLMEGHLGCRNPGRLYLPAVPPQLHLWDLGAYGGNHHHSLERCSHLEPRKKANGWGGMWRGVMCPKMHIIFLFSH